MRKRYVVSVSVSNDIAEMLKKLRENHTNISRLVESAIREYVNKMFNASSPNQSSSIDLTKYVVIERSVYFNNVCRELLKKPNDEIFRLGVGMVYANALSLMYTICSKAFGQDQKSGGQK